MATVRRRRPAVVTTYTPAALLASRLGDYITQPEPTGDGEMRMFCPICEVPGESRTPSASINPTLGKWHCLGKCSEGGSILALTQQLGVKIRGSASRASTAKKKPALPEPLDDQTKPLYWHDKFMRGECAEFLDFLTQERGLHPDTLAYFHIGADGERVTIPVYVRSQCVNVRRYLPHATGGKQKMLNLPGHGSPAVLAFTETLAGNSLPVVVTEGELDALLLWQESAGRLAVVTGTGGAGTPPPDVSALRGREVWVAYDNDDAGRKGAEKFAARAKAAGAHVRVLDLARLGLSGDGADVSDYLLRGGTVEALLAEMERLRSDPETPRERFKVVSAADLAAPVPPMQWLVRGVFPLDTYGVLAGEKKTLKTYTDLALALAVASGEPFLGEFTVPAAQPVLMYLGEGGERPTRRRLQRLAEWMGVDLASLPLRMVFDAGDITGDEFMGAFERAVADEAPGLVIVDPFYAFHPAGVEAQNLYDRGAMLAGIVQMIPEGASFLLADHFRKTGGKELDLDSVAQAGIAQWADSWILQAHASPARVDEGEFSLAVQFGSRQWGGAQYTVDWSLGRFDQETGEHDGALRVAVQRAEWGAKASDVSGSAVQSHIVALLESEPLVHTVTQAQNLVAERTGKGSATVRREWAALVGEGRIVSQPTAAQEGSREVIRPRWRTVPAEAQKLTIRRENGAEDA